MIKAIIVDDERGSAELLAYYLKQAGQVEVAGCFFHPLRALEALENGLNVDVAFLDIEMPEMNGLELAASIRINAEVVFVTAYDRYAIKAFELNAVNYLLKPVDPDRLQQVTERLKKIIRRNETIKSSANNDDYLEICVFGKTQYIFGKEPVEFRWRTAKAEEMMLFLAMRKKTTRRELIEVLFADAEDSKAEKLLHTTIFYLRNQLREYCRKDSVIYENGNYFLCDRIINADMKRFGDSCKALAVVNDGNYAQAQQVFDSYGGDVLAGKYYNWCERQRMQLREVYCALAKRLVNYYDNNNCSGEALAVACKAADLASESENSMLLLLETLGCQGKIIELKRTYLKYCEYLMKEFECGPSEQVTMYYCKYAG